ncbi:Dabb family protein [Enteractinococcus coprophilus]|uniref:Stress responsive alpha/beta barrel protein n=1 Tax=Enteractinococcus coprophilus TaxID=1027633 RepID=A0A543ANI8_9MICC|nr:Dabb family protein [Enteractinococcus coprophilus]TQL74144.1 stress responsive alpha/beta barrel protein [Enteractinococcus coprophilus]
MTLRHIVNWKLNGETFAARNGQAAKIAEALEALPARIPEIRDLKVYRNELHEGANFDLILIADFDDAEGLAVYADHPEHVPVVEMIKGMISDRVAVDFTV